MNRQKVLQQKCTSQFSTSNYRTWWINWNKASKKLDKYEQLNSVELDLGGQIEMQKITTQSGTLLKQAAVLTCYFLSLYFYYLTHFFYMEMCRRCEENTHIRTPVFTIVSKLQKNAHFSYSHHCRYRRRKNCKREKYMRKLGMCEWLLRVGLITMG